MNLSRLSDLSFRLCTGETNPITLRSGVCLGMFDESPYFGRNVAKIKNSAILNEVPPVVSALKLNSGQRWGSYLWLARTRTKLADNSCIVV